MLRPICRCSIRTQQKDLLVLTATIEETADKIGKPDERWVSRRAQNVRTAIELGECVDALAEMKGLVAETEKLKGPSRVKLKPLVTKLERMLKAACSKAMSVSAAKDGGARP